MEVGRRGSIYVYVFTPGGRGGRGMQVLTGRIKDGLALMTEVVEDSRAEEDARSGRRSASPGSREGLLVAEEYEPAWERALEVAGLFAPPSARRGQEAWTLHLLGDIAGRRQPGAPDDAERFYRDAMAIAEPLRHASRGGALPLGLGELYVRTGRRRGARALAYRGRALPRPGNRALAGAGGAAARHTSRMTRAPVYRWLVPRVVAPLAERLRLPAWTTERRLGELQWRSPEELEERALSRLRSLLAHTARHVPHYRQLLAGVDARDIQGDGRSRPGADHHQGRAAGGLPRRTTAENLPASRRQPMMTSGSTGLPFELYWDRSVLPVLGGTDRFWLGWSGIAVWHTRIVIASPAYFYERIKPPRRLHALANRLVIGERSENLPADQITTAKFRSLVERVTPRGPYFIRSYPGALASLAAGLVKDGTPLASYPRAVVTLAETLTSANAARSPRGFPVPGGEPLLGMGSTADRPQLSRTAPDTLHVNSSESSFAWSGLTAPTRRLEKRAAWW